ncbi:MAG: hypothetical protein C0463_03475 [Idiomarina sp.]|nr:hypothetical protein [Idiomarina sp.]
MTSANLRFQAYVKPLFLLAMLSYVPPFLWFLVTGQGIYQHGYHVLLVLLASGPATGASVRSARLATFLIASLCLNFFILLLDAFGLRLNMAISFGALVLLALSVMAYYALWGIVLYLRWKHKR